jgi:hypothetical protein
MTLAGTSIQTRPRSFILEPSPAIRARPSTKYLFDTMLYMPALL